MIEQILIYLILYFGIACVVYMISNEYTDNQFNRMCVGLLWPLTLVGIVMYGVVLWYKTIRNLFE
jgi:hypothetical protein